MADEAKNDTDAGLGRLPEFPPEAGDSPLVGDERPPQPHYRWLYAGLILGAVFGLVAAIPEGPLWLGLPGRLVAIFTSLIPGMPAWVATWLCPAIGWGGVGGLAGWALDDFQQERERRNRLFRD